ncbi:dihydrolipoyl dehydrogenase [bacterium]|nr:dihydrolipoyl dehydrogenase [bacterium]RQV97960.1 MAG: dihydrolipoyl dehydrogenase [bacterium]
MSDLESRKVIVIGAGPGGYAAAFRAADFGMHVTLIDQSPNPGGVCLYRGCIPSKALLHAAKIIEDTKQAASIGLSFGKPKINLNQLRTWKTSVVERLTGGLGVLAKQRKVMFVQGTAVFESSNSVKVTKPDRSKEIFKFDHAILAVGSRSIRLTGAPDDLWDSTKALALEEVPETLLIVGGGYIGLELGSVYANLGSRVTVVEMLPQVMTGADRDLVSVFLKKAEGMFEAIYTQTKVDNIQFCERKYKVRFSSQRQNLNDKVFNQVLVSIGRKPNTDSVGLEKTKVRLNDNGFVRVNPNRQTDDPSIFAIGDITGGPLLAHKAAHEGKTAAESIAGKKAAFEPTVIPGIVYTNPEIAWCGLTETEAKAAGDKFKVAKFPWAASGRALTMGVTNGITKLVIDPDTERILGVGLAGTGAGELISEGALAVEMAALASDISFTIHPHPTLSETIMEAADVFYGTSTHIFRPRRS